MATAVVNFVLGAAIKAVTGMISNWMDYKRQKDLAVLNAPKDLLVALQSGTDKADPFTRMTRRILAIGICGTFMYILYHLSVVAPDTQFHVFVGKEQSWLWRFLNPFPINDKGVMMVSGATLLWQAWEGMWLILGFYFTKIGK